MKYAWERFADLCIVALLAIVVICALLMLIDVAMDVQIKEGGVSTGGGVLPDKGVACPRAHIMRAGLCYAR